MRDFGPSLKKEKIMARTKEQEKRYQKQYTKDHVMVKGKFKFNEVPGGLLRFTYLKYKGDNTLKYELTDGEVYDLPYMVAKHLAHDVAYPVHAFETDEHGKSIVKVGRMVHRTSFERLDFLDDDDLVPSKILTAEIVS